MIFFLRSLQYNALAVCHRIISEKNSHGFHDKQTYGSVLLFMKNIQDVFPGFRSVNTLTLFALCHS